MSGSRTDGKSGTHRIILSRSSRGDWTTWNWNRTNGSYGTDRSYRDDGRSILADWTDRTNWINGSNWRHGSGCCIDSHRSLWSNGIA